MSLTGFEKWRYTKNYIKKTGAYIQEEIEVLHGRKELYYIDTILIRHYWYQDKHMCKIEHKYKLCLTTHYTRFNR